MTKVPKLKIVDGAFPPKLEPLFSPCRYKIIYGGRGSGKSWSVARALLILGFKFKLRILCCREIMQSIQDSVYKLLCDQIFELGLTEHYEIQGSKILGRNGTEIRFSGLKSNVQQIKSFESLNIIWVEEASNVSDISWETIIPTMRAEGFIPGTDSEIWMTLNPHLETDATYKRFIIDPPPEAWVCEMNWRDNPWFPPALQREMERLKQKDHDRYLHVYEGQCRRFLEGAVYTEQMVLAEREGRIDKVACKPGIPVHAYFDLGYADSTAIWISQKDGNDVRVLHYIENSRKPLDWYLNKLAELPYKIDRLWLPHDARQRSTASNGKSTEEQVRAKGHKVSITPSLSIAEGINAVRELFPFLYFDRKNCAEGLNALRHYRFEVRQDAAGGLKDVPVHDRWSHGNDALRYMCVALRDPRPKPDAATLRKAFNLVRYGTTGWMAR